ncbi:MAG: hypothetical protein P8R42_24385 [Candidatus Binatia bacterium]|nr:hypothetical protein [Candidatus Binatia bacterium]
MEDRFAWLSDARWGRAGLVLVGAIVGLLDPLALLITVRGALAVSRVTFCGEAIQDAWEHLRQALYAENSEELQTERGITTFKRLARIHRVADAAREEEDVFVRRAVQQSLECNNADEV